MYENQLSQRDPNKVCFLLQKAFIKAMLTLHCIAFTLHCFALLCIALHCVALHCVAWRCVATRGVALCVALHSFVKICVALCVDLCHSTLLSSLCALRRDALIVSYMSMPALLGLGLV